ncbi:tyrosine-type recombinase/integrase [Lentibacillus cibarius]|uniref:Site-specific integrase n=1 Tax=Lentibacillus cibarius TaxID=2583219 RepID=A0A5S3QJN2_9BACI|nr:tyrosine-type recombinase/integrase [Lentibacillus cibarius]TMN18813.1 site-specific integrase [Lentibacillus cibarius]
MAKNERIINVQPLRTKEEIDEMKLAIKRGNKGAPKRPELAQRDVLIFLIGINTGLRVNDIIRLTVGDVKGKNQFVMYEGKTAKRREVNVSMLQDEIERYTECRHPGESLFKSQKGDGHITTTQVYRILDDAADFLGRDDVGTHTMRKTFGYHHYKQFKDVAILQEIFNHAQPSITKRYIGIRKDEIDDTLNDFRLG